MIGGELATLKAAGTWILEEAPPGANIIGSKWVFKAKKDAAGVIAHLKAHLVAQGFSQIGGVNYDNTYAPVARLASSRAIIAMANCLDLLLHQVDIKGAYFEWRVERQPRCCTCTTRPATNHVMQATACYV